MGGETGIVLVTQAADFVFDGRHVKVTSDTMVAFRNGDNCAPHIVILRHSAF
jgi:hypothetical protein